MKNAIVGLKELRENIETYITEVKKGKSFIVVRRSKPILKISAPDEDEGMWEEVVDFTKINKGGIVISNLISRL